MRFALVGAPSVSLRMPKGVVMAVLLAAAIVPRQSRAQAPAAVAPVVPADDDNAGGSDDAPHTAGVDAAALEQRLAQSEALVRNSQPTVSARRLRRPGVLRAAGGRRRATSRTSATSTFPQYDPLLYPGLGFGWVFLGDILAPAVNTRGEVADLGRRRPASHRFDSINSRGAPGFIAQRGQPVACARR